MHYNLFCWLPLIIPILLWLGACKMVNGPNSDINPNIIILLTDDQGWGDLSLTGNPVIRTPNIDALAANGALFDRFYVNPVCSPTRAEMLTGRYHVRSGVFDTGAGGERLDLDETTFAEVFKRAGYNTAAYGKWHNGMQPPYHPNARGFDEYYGFCSGHWGNYFSPILERNGKLVKGQGFLVDDLTEKAMQFIEDHQENPFVVYLAYNTPHSPMQVPDQWWEQYKTMDLKLDHRMAGEEDIQHTKAAYAMCENIDWNVGRIVEKVESLNLIEKTIVIYFSDNGPNGWRWNGDMKGRKGSTDEGGVRSPFMVQWQGVIEPGTKVEEIAGAIDIFPSILDLANISHKSDQPLDGISIKPYLFGEKPSHNERLLFSYWNKKLSVRSQNYRLDHAGNLFDMINDPGQRLPVQDQADSIFTLLIQAKSNWEKDVLTELQPEVVRPFTVGHPNFSFTQLPARDAIALGNIKRSNRWPNCSFFTNWTSLEDSITWDVDILSSGRYNAQIYYTCPKADIGSTIQLSFKSTSITYSISEDHDPPLLGMEHDRVERGESYVKDFKPMDIGVIDLPKGIGKLVLNATKIPGNQVMDFRLLMLDKI